MYRKRVKDRYFLLLILFVFCLSSPMLGGSLLYGTEIHYGQHNVHMHGHGIGEEVPSDVNITVYYDFLAITYSNYSKSYTIDNPPFHVYSLPENYWNFFNISLRIKSHPDINRFYPPGLYKLNSLYIIQVDLVAILFFLPV